MVKKKRKGNSSSDDIYDAEHIVRHKYENGKLLYRVKWKGWSSNYDTWEVGTCMRFMKIITRRSDNENEGELRKLNCSISRSPKRTSWTRG